jgi:predicted secreted protein
MLSNPRVVVKCSVESYGRQVCEMLPSDLKILELPCPVALLLDERFSKDRMNW